MRRTLSNNTSWSSPTAPTPASWTTQFDLFHKPYWCESCQRYYTAAEDHAALLCAVRQACKEP